MKKFVVLWSVTAVLLLGICVAGTPKPAAPTVVRSRELTEQTVEPYITCEGVVGAKNRYDIYAEYPCVADHVAVREGDRVAAGDVLFNAQPQDTRALLSAAGQYGESETAAAQAQVVTSPVNGVVIQVNAADGSTVSNTKPCFSVAGTDELELTVAVPEKHLPRVFVGQSVRITGDGFSRESYCGTVTAISSSAHTLGSETVVNAQVAFLPEEQDESLRLGLSATARFITETREHSLVIPYEALAQDEDGQEYVYVVENGCAVKRAVVTSQALDEGLLVEEGLVAGEHLVEQADAVPGPGALLQEEA